MDLLATVPLCAGLQVRCRLHALLPSALAFKHPVPRWHLMLVSGQSKLTAKSAAPHGVGESHLVVQ